MRWQAGQDVAARAGIQPNRTCRTQLTRRVSKCSVDARPAPAPMPGNRCRALLPMRTSKGSLGHAFTVRIRTGNQNQKSFYPCVPHEISVLVELILGHLRYLLTDVPPQSNSPPDNVFHRRTPLVRTSSELAVRHAGKAPEGTVPSPSPRRHVETRSRRRSSSSSPPKADGFGSGTLVPSPQSQSFSQTYGSILPTSLAYIIPSTRGCSPCRPDAVMSTTGCGRHLVLRIFKGRRERTGHHVTCGALPTAGPYLVLSRLQGGHAIKQKRRLFLRLPPTSPDFLTLPSTATSRFKNFNPIPFRSSRETRYLSGFPRPLGSTNPCASAIHMEPFPSSAFKVLI
ncbi:Regulator of rDNA transcription protein 15 [Capsicum baccatum]|uniref:Regulator of rDNA transcription protein 15 n=1 Tax=Capsicum baccatum TaxID=33114 RepID=A0A2G2UXA4_CAPBA|nr:Regulator of rDNA transcription protein 15 [Capsicum baccatum]